MPFGGKLLLVWFDGLSDCYIWLIGLYLTGGLTPKNINWIKDPNGPFMSAFYDKVSLDLKL
jgi:hypothetical protein